MKVKQGVSLVRMQKQMRIVLVEVAKIWRSLGQEPVITAGDEITDENGSFIHSEGSLHPFGLALDFRTRYFNDVEKKTAGQALQSALPIGYQVIIHSTHIHVEYDAGK